MRLILRVAAGLALILVALYEKLLNPQLALDFLAEHAKASAGFALRMRAMRDHGQASTGFAEDAVMLSTALAAIHAPLPGRRPASGY